MAVLSLLAPANGFIHESSSCATHPFQRTNVADENAFRWVASNIVGPAVMHWRRDLDEKGLNILNDWMVKFSDKYLRHSWLICKQASHRIVVQADNIKKFGATKYFYCYMSILLLQLPGKLALHQCRQNSRDYLVIISIPCAHIPRLFRLRTKGTNVVVPDSSRSTLINRPKNKILRT